MEIGWPLMNSLRDFSFSVLLNLAQMPLQEAFSSNCFSKEYFLEISV